MSYKTIYFFIFLLLLMSCNKDTTNPDSNLYTVMGKISNENGPISGASVSIDKKINWTVETSSLGEFQIDNVSEGEHNISISKTENDDSFIERNEDLAVYSDVDLDLIKLPIPVKMNEAFNISVADISLSWNSTDAEDFREYKLYRRDSPGLDETTGELIFVSTERSDTSFTDTGLISNKTYYYRVYVMNEYGRIGGSNIVNATTKIGNLVPDGGFEIISSINDHWNIKNGSGANYLTALVDSVKKEGQYSLYNLNPEAYTGGAINTWTVLNLNKPISLGVQTTYKLSFWVKAKGKITDIGSIEIYVKQGQTYVESLSLQASYPNIGEEIDIDWTYEEITFFITEDDPINLEIYFPVEEVWIDELSLVSQ